MPWQRLLALASVFGAAFGVIEAAVVVYLRELYYPDGFSFPLRDLPGSILAMEVVREAATIVLLLAAAWMAERGGARRFALFAYCFALWDLVYYAVLKVVLGWPASLLDWDLLFLIPLPWVAPVLAPVLVSLALLAGAVAILREPRESPRAALRPRDWLVLCLAGLVIVASFLANTAGIGRREVPEVFPWPIFAAGFLGGCAWFAWAWNRKTRPS